jgi:hypothetical protein
MAVRFDASGEDYTSTSSPPSGSAFTVICWAKVSTDRNTWSAAWSSDSSTSNYSYLSTDSDGTTMKWWTQVSGNERTISGPNMTAGTWYRFAAVCNGTDATLYYGSGLGALSSASAANWVTLSTSTTFRIGADPFSGEWLNGCIANLKHYSTNLTQAEIERELLQYMPERTTNLVRWHPFLTNETVDYSGNARTLSGGTGTAREDGPPIPWLASPPRVYVPPAGGNPPVTLGLATETDTSTALTRSKRLTISQSLETDTATALGRRKTRSVTQASESSTATSLTRSKRATVAQATSAETATAVTRTKRSQVAQVTESDTATALARTKRAGLTQATEADSSTSLVRSKRLNVAQATETDTAQPITLQGQNIVPLGQAVETSTATSLTRAKRLTISAPLETDTAAALARLKARALTLASESDTATVLTRRKTKQFGQAQEIDTARPVTVEGQNVVVLGQATEADTAVTLARAKRLGLGHATEISVALTLTRIRSVQVGVAAETCSTTALNRAKRLMLGGAVETDTALTFPSASVEPGRRSRMSMATTGHRIRSTPGVAPRISSAHSGGGQIRNPESL